jgi:hypothetical protein
MLVPLFNRHSKHLTRSIELPKTCINQEGPEENCFGNTTWLEVSPWCSMCEEDCKWEEHDRYREISYRTEYVRKTKSGRVKKSTEWGHNWHAKYPTVGVNDTESFLPDTYVPGESHLFKTRVTWSSMTRTWGMSAEQHKVKGPEEGREEFIRDINRVIPVVKAIAEHRSLFESDRNNWQLVADEGGIRIAIYAHGEGYMYVMAFRYPDNETV